MKQSYSMLSDEDQEQLWKTKLNYILRHDRLTNGQSVLIRKMLIFLSETGMTTMKNDSTIPVKFIQENANEFYRHFSSEQLYFVIEHPFVKYGFSLRHAKVYMNELGVVKNYSSLVAKEEVAGSCTCRYDIGCGFGNYCKKGGCSGGKDCGLFGTSACKGYCVQGNGGPVLYEEELN